MSKTQTYGNLINILLKDIFLQFLSTGFPKQRKNKTTLNLPRILVRKKQNYN